MEKKSRSDMKEDFREMNRQFVKNKKKVRLLRESDDLLKKIKNVEGKMRKLSGEFATLQGILDEHPEYSAATIRNIFPQHEAHKWLNSVLYDFGTTERKLKSLLKHHAELLEKLQKRTDPASGTETDPDALAKILKECGIPEIDCRLLRAMPSGIPFNKVLKNLNRVIIKAHEENARSEKGLRKLAQSAKLCGAVCDDFKRYGYCGDDAQDDGRCHRSSHKSQVIKTLKSKK
jgi:hypothetical protein